MDTKRTTCFRILWLTGLACLWTWLPLAAQPTPFQTFIQAQLRRDADEALRLLGQQPDSLWQPGTWLAQPSLFLLDSVLQSRVPLSAAAQSALLHAYPILAAHQPDQRLRWEREAAAVALYFRHQLRDSLLPVLSRALRHQPRELPPATWQELARQLSEQRPDTPEAWARWLDAYLVLDEVLLHMPVIHPEYLREADLRHRELRALLALLGPTCSELRQREAARVQMGFPSAREYAHLFMQMEAKSCGWGSLEDTVRRRAALLLPEPGLLLRIADSYLQEDNFWEAQRLLLLAVKAEDDPHLRAAMELKLAGLYAIRRSFLSARLHALEAQALAPDWGQPWLFLSELVESSAALCADSDHDRLALTFLAIDYAERAVQQNPDLEATVATRLALLRQRLPNQEELHFLGLRPGDTLPLGCWIEEVVKVR